MLTRNACAALFTLCASLACADITVGLVVTRSEAETLSRWQPVLDDLAVATGEPVRAVALENYDALVERMKRGEVQVARMGNRQALQAVENANAEVFGSLVMAGGVDTYQSLLLTRRGGDLDTLVQIISLGQRGRLRFAGGKPSSFSGFLLPQYLAFLKANILFEQHFKSVQTGSHKDNFLAVARGEVDVATGNTDDLTQLRQQFPIEFGRVQIAWRSPGYTFDPLVVRRDLTPLRRQKIVSFFLRYGRDGANAAVQRQKLLAADNLAGFRVSDNRQLRQVSDLQLFHDLFRLMLDTHLAPTERDAQAKQHYRRHARLIALLGGAR